MKINQKNNSPLDEKNNLALKRTELARVRTGLAWIRTILSIIVFIVVMLKVMNIW